MSNEYHSSFAEAPVSELLPDFETGALFTQSDLPHFTNHRQRLRNWFMTAGRTSLADYELLELLLFRAIPRWDVKPMAKVSGRIRGL